MSDAEQKLLKEIHKVALQVEMVKTRQTENHKENKADIKVLFEKVSKLDDLPCAAHVEKFVTYDKHTDEGDAWRKSISDKVGNSLLTVFTLCIAVGIAWGVLHTKVSTHLDYSAKEMEQCCGKSNP